jgi:hypothetical protein
MPTNARIDRLTREALGPSRTPPELPHVSFRTAARITLVVIALGAVAGTLSPDNEVPASAHRFVGVTPADSASGTSASGNVRDFTY